MPLLSSVILSGPTRDPVDCSRPGFPVHHLPLELTQTHVHRVGDAIQPAHLLSSPSPPAFNLAKLGGQKSEGGSGGSDQLEAEEDWPRVVGHSETVQLRMGFEPMF